VITHANEGQGQRGRNENKTFKGDIVSNNMESVKILGLSLFVAKTSLQSPFVYLETRAETKKMLPFCNKLCINKREIKSGNEMVL